MVLSKQAHGCMTMHRSVREMAPSSAGTQVLVRQHAMQAGALVTQLRDLKPHNGDQAGVLEPIVLLDISMT